MVYSSIVDNISNRDRASVEDMPALSYDTFLVEQSPADRYMAREQAH